MYFLYLLLRLVTSSKFLEYNLWKNHGQVIFDYSLNERHAVNGLTKSPDSLDCLYSDRGLYFSHDYSYLKQPPNEYANKVENLISPFSVLMWISIIKPGRCFSRYSSTSYFGLKITNIYKYMVDYDSLDGLYTKSFSDIQMYSNWNLIVISVTISSFTLFLNNIEIINLTLPECCYYLEDSSTITSGYGSDNPSFLSFQGFLWYTALVHGEAIENFIYVGSSNDCLSSISCSCNPAFKLDLTIGCITDNLNLTINSNEKLCNFSKCEGGLLRNCSCVSQSCFFEIKTECDCLSSNIEIEDVCICPDGKTCCNQGCLTCNYTDLCTSCIDENATIGKNSLCYCKEGFFGNFPLSSSDSCEPCHKNCSKCENQDFCTQCKGPNRILVNGICECSKGFFLNSFEICESCPLNCLECDSNSTCLKCFGNLTVIDKFKCGCEIGYWKSRNDDELECFKCSDGCRYCDNGEDCLDCYDQLLLGQDGKCLCKNGFYYDGNNECKKCSENCFICDSITDCLDCEKGYKIRNSSCIPKYFVLIPTINDQNEITLMFDKPLQKNLSEADLKFESSAKIISFQLIQNNAFKYNIIFRFGNDVANGTVLNLSINKMIYSIDEFMLMSLNYSLKLYEYRAIPKILKKLVENAEKASRTSTLISFSFAMFSDPSAGWVLLNTVQLIYFIPISIYPLTPVTTKFCKALGKLDSPVNIPKLIMNKNSLSIPSISARNIGIESNDIWINIGMNVTILGSLFLLFPILVLISKIKISFLQEKIEKLKSEYKFNLVIRTWIQSHLAVGVYGCICFNSKIEIISFQSVFSKVSSEILLVTFIKVCFFASPVIIFLTLWIDADKIQSNDGQYLKKYGSLFHEFHQDKGLIYFQYYSVLGMRAVIFVVNQMYEGNNEYLQKSINCLTSLFLVIFLIKYRPYKERLIFLTNITTEFLIFLIFLLILGRSFFDFLKDDWIFDLSFINVLIVGLAIQYLACFLVFINKVVSIIKKKKLEAVTQNLK